MKILKGITAVALSAALGLSIMGVYAHPGRLDKNGGHRKTSDGSYHYHLGSDRSVEYSSKPSSSSQTSSKSSSSISSTSSTSNYVPPKPKQQLFASDLNMFIRGKRIQTYSCTGDNPCYGIVAEDLEHYGFDTKWIEFHNVQRAAGNSKWNFSKLFAYAMEGMFSFSTAPIVWIGNIGTAIMISSILMTLFGLLVHVTSMFHLVCLILFLSGLQMLFVAILGQYTTKDYMESKQRPIYIVKETSKNLS